MTSHQNHSTEWTKEAPTEEGWYWILSGELNLPRVVKVGSGINQRGEIMFYVSDNGLVIGEYNAHGYKEVDVTYWKHIPTPSLPK